jgi:hypothetical protein
MNYPSDKLTFAVQDRIQTLIRNAEHQRLVDGAQKIPHQSRVKTLWIALMTRCLLLPGR